MQRDSYWIATLLFSLLGITSGCGGGSGSNDLDGGGIDGGAIDATIQPDAMVACPNDTVRCTGECVDPLLDPRFCGATTCENDATDGEQCGLGSVCDGAGACEAFVCDAVDTGGGAGTCNPVTQAGCATGEKCAEFIVSASPFLAQTLCVPDGTIAADAACTICGNGMDGYDDCLAGNDCFAGKCLSICGSAPDTCRPNPDPGFGNGSRCANNFANHFADDIGVCVSACNPTNDTVVAGVAVNASCGTGSSCGLNASAATTSCAGTPDGSLGKTQNHIPFGPGKGLVFANGCASGFSTLLNEKVGSDPGNSQCTRFCSPTDTYENLANSAEGMANKCSSTALDTIGGRNGHDVAHQCRFIQAIYSNTDLVPASVGMCMPITPAGGGVLALGNGATAAAPSYGDCTLFEWELLKTSWNAAAPQGSDAANAAFDTFCLSDPGNPAASTILNRCIGFFFGCISNATLDELNPPSNAAISVSDIRGRLTPNLQATTRQLESL